MYDSDITTVPAILSYILGFPTLLLSIGSVIIFHSIDSEHITTSESYGPIAMRLSIALLSALVAGYEGKNYNRYCKYL